MSIRKIGLAIVIAIWPGRSIGQVVTGNPFPHVAWSLAERDLVRLGYHCPKIESSSGAREIHRGFEWTIKCTNGVEYIITMPFAEDQRSSGNPASSANGKNARLDELDAHLNGSRLRVTNYQTTYESLWEETSKVALSSSRLEKNPSELQIRIATLNDQFKDAGVYISSSVQSVDDLIKKLGELQQEQIKVIGAELKFQGIQLQEKVDIQKRDAASLIGDAGVNRLILGQPGAGRFYRPK